MKAGGQDGFDMSDRPFYPQIFHDGAYHPICGVDFNDEAAATGTCCQSFVTSPASST